MGGVSLYACVVRVPVCVCVCDGGFWAVRIAV